MNVTIALTINGERRTVQTHPMARLLDVLREELRLTGTKEGCGEGECGACSILIDGDAAMSCMIPAIQADGATIETIEGLASRDGGLHPLQQAFIECGGAQCGICTPGMIIAAEAYLRNPRRVPGGIPEALEGNLCRCTGYMRIFEAVRKAQDTIATGGTR